MLPSARQVVACQLPRILGSVVESGKSLRSHSTTLACFPLVHTLGMLPLDLAVLCWDAKFLSVSMTGPTSPGAADSLIATSMKLERTTSSWLDCAPQIELQSESPPFPPHLCCPRASSSIDQVRHRQKHDRTRKKGQERDHEGEESEEGRQER